MTREEEIKSRHKNGYWTVQRTFSVPDGFDGGICRVIDKDQKDKDFEWLLARNEELKRRVERMENALQFYARLDDDMEYDEVEEDHGRRAVDALDAKEQDDV